MSLILANSQEKREKHLNQAEHISEKIVTVEVKARWYEVLI